MNFMKHELVGSTKYEIKFQGFVVLFLIYIIVMIVICTV